jgi:hypothetical protein
MACNRDWPSILSYNGSFARLKRCNDTGGGGTKFGFGHGYLDGSHYDVVRDKKSVISVTELAPDLFIAKHPA